MNNFLNSLKYRLRVLMQGRYGADSLTRFQLITGIVVYILGIVLRLRILTSLSFVLYVWAMYRTLSRNRVARIRENQRFLEISSAIKQKPRQYRLRFENRKEYKYFMCPKCRATLRMKRGSGLRTVTCGKCGHRFDKKA